MSSYGLAILDPPECQALLSTQRIGRVGLATPTPMVLPVQYAMFDGDVVFRTAPGEKLIAAVPGREASEQGKVAMIENTVDATTGMVTVRGIMDNGREALWPGTLVNTRLIVRRENAVVVPSAAVQRSQNGDFVFVVADGKAKVQRVTVSRTSSGNSSLASRLGGSSTSWPASSSTASASRRCWVRVGP